MMHQASGSCSVWGLRSARTAEHGLSPICNRTSIDYYLQPQDVDALIAMEPHGLEVSGILKENPETGNTVEKRYKEKLRRLQKTEHERDYIPLSSSVFPAKMVCHE